MIYSVDALEAQGWEKIIDKQNGKRYKLHSMNISIFYEFMVGRCCMGGWFGEEQGHLSYSTDTLEAVVEVMREMERECKTNEQISQKKTCKNCIHKVKLDLYDCDLHKIYMGITDTCDDWLGW